MSFKHVWRRRSPKLLGQPMVPALCHPHTPSHPWCVTELPPWQCLPISLERPLCLAAFVIAPPCKGLLAGPGSGSWGEMTGSWKSNTYSLAVHCTSPHHNHLPLQVLKTYPPYRISSAGSRLHSIWNINFLGFFTVSHLLPWIFTFSWRTFHTCHVWWTLALWKPVVL